MGERESEERKEVTGKATSLKLLGRYFSFLKKKNNTKMGKKGGKMNDLRKFFSLLCIH